MNGKQFIEVREGFIVEISGLRKISMGDAAYFTTAGGQSPREGEEHRHRIEGTQLFLEFAGNSKMTIPFDSIEDKQKGYKKLRDVLIPETAAEEPE